MAKNATISFRIKERINYTGTVTVDQDDLKAYMEQYKYPALNEEVIRNYMELRGIENTEEDGDVQGQDFDQFEIETHDNAPAIITIAPGFEA